jgi:uncharacterized protein (DUF58 family)
MAALSMAASFSTGNNLLYVLFGVVTSSLAVSWLLGRVNISGIKAEAFQPDQVFRGDLFTLRLRLTNAGRLPSFGIRVREALAARLGPGEGFEAAFPFTFRHRGRNAVAGVDLESLFPFGFFRHAASLTGLEGTALPRMREVHAEAEITADASLTGRPRPKKGRGDELFGIREYDTSDDSRLINWKLSAKQDKTLVNEYCVAGDSRVTIRLENLGTGEPAELRVTEAASAFRWYIDTGAEVRLVTSEGGVDYGKGLLHLDKALRFLALLGEGKSVRPSTLQASAGPAVADTPALRRWTFFGTAIVYASLFLVDEIGTKPLLALLPAVPLGWALHEKKVWRGSRLFWDPISAAVLIYILALDWRYFGVAVANVHLVLYLLVNRAVNDVKPNELAQWFLILFLGFFLASGLTLTPWYFLVFLLYIAFAGVWLCLASGLEFSERRDWLPGLGAGVVGVLALASLLFFFSPRRDSFRHINPFTAMGIDKLQPKASTVAGFGDGVSLGWYGELKRSSSRMMRVRPLMPTGPGEPPPLYVRGAAFDEFDGRRWKKSKADFVYRYGKNKYNAVGGRAWTPRQGELLRFPGKGSDLPPVLEFIYYPVNLTVLFTVGAVNAVVLPSGAVYFDHTDSAYLASPYTRGLRYTLVPRQGEAGFGSAIEGYDAMIASRFLQLPDSDPRVAELAARITGNSRTDMEKAKAVEAHLRRSYAYSTYSTSRQKTLPDFLFKDRKGNCEFFATAAAVLLRHAGVPTRLVTGFLASEWNEYGRFYDVRQGQAHAWVEAYAGGRWVTLEPTPASGFSLARDAFFSRLERMMNALELRWYRHVIGYDSYSQRDTFFRLSQTLTKERVLGWIKTAGRPVGVLAVLAGLLLLLARVRQGLRARPTTLYGRASRLLEKAGVAREPSMTPLEHALKARSSRPELEPVVELVELHYRERYSGKGLAAAEVEKAEALMERVRSLVTRGA